MDLQSILWCNQLVKQTAAALAELFADKKPTNTSDSDSLVPADYLSAKERHHILSRRFQSRLPAALGVLPSMSTTSNMKSQEDYECYSGQQ